MVHIRQCSARNRQQWLVAKWLGLSVTVRVRAMTKARVWSPFFMSKCD